ncbi:UxaA family hydrolase [Oceanibium sediminis]|uniref:UxaA family hydrolase n=1 Tax=Oceanibium sediminis TaxID=2026339 RepID=UPI000DD3097D|nr:UxaA family hydrolase [Oceanibium sediminis]
MDTPTSPTAGVLLRLHAADNVLVATGPVGPGPTPVSGSGTLELRAKVTLGHKVAAEAIAAGAQIMKYGVPIGSATDQIPAGAHVHVDNMKSDYTPTYALDATAGGDS